MKILQEQDFIRKIQTGVWIINPDILIKGNGGKQERLREDYQKAGLIEKDEKKDGKDDSGKQEKHKEVCEDSCEKNSPVPEDWDYDFELDLDSDSIFGEKSTAGT